MDLLVLIAQLIAFILAFLVLIILVLISQFFAPKQSSVSAVKEKEVDDWKKEMEMKPKRKLKLWEKHAPIETFEILYWQGVYEPWRYNVYSLELIKYAKENLPHRHLEFSIYNSNKNDPEYEKNKARIEKLRGKKTRFFPLIVLNYDEEIKSIESSYHFEAMKARIDAEWDRYYGLV